ncbi:MAG: ATP-dependent exonuclease [Bacteroidetes bacterium MedPE-SWsnd-G2]|nr:MAG: ATP-dependent exonuclease [Bacteroidetes bacterium MedPE-SWsnd-G2]
MKYTFLIFAFLLASASSNAQDSTAFNGGEFFKFRVSYSGYLTAGEATLAVHETQLNGKPVFHVVGKGKSTGAVRWFYKIDDLYESYFDKYSGLPYKFIRKIDEGGHTKDVEIEFDQESNTAHVNNKKHKVKSKIPTETAVQDMISAFYFLRNNYETDSIKIGEEVSLNMFFDEENYKFKLRFLGRERLDTKFGVIETLKFRPLVMAGRVFKEQESLTLWVSADQNKVPLKIKADLAVGSLRADLKEFKGLKHPFLIEFD